MTSIVYVLTNEAMPGLIKIGITSDVSQRLSQLYTTGVPLPFQCTYAAEVQDAGAVENALHHAFGHQRVTDRREFFELEPSRAIAILRLLTLREVTPGAVQQDVTPDEERAVTERSQRRARFNFSMVGISVGEELHFLGEPEITATVHSNTKIVFDNEVISLSPAAAIVLEERGYEWASKAVQGPGYWTYDGETLHERRVRMEEADD